MQNVANIQRNLSPYMGKSTVIVDNHDVDDIITALQTRQKKYQPEYDKISEKFWRNNATDTARNLFDFLKKNIIYKIEPDINQSVRSPQAILSMGSGDCKHYASFINGILSSLKRKGYPVGECLYRYAGYNPMTGDLHHVFSVLKDGSNEIWIDPVLPTFNNRKKYFVNKDKSANMLREINGIPNYDGDNVGNIFDDIKKGASNTVKKVTSAVKTNAANATKEVKKIAQGAKVNAENIAKGVKITAKNVTTGAKNTFDKTKKVLLKINPASVAARNAFLGLLKVNAFNMAHRLYDFIHRSKANEQEVYEKWTGLGGENNKIKTAITQGMQGYLARHKQSMADYNKKNNLLAGIPELPKEVQKYYEVKCWEFPHHIPAFSDSGYKKGIGVDPASITAMMTLASAIIALFSGIFKKAGWSKQDQASAEIAVAAGAQTLSDIAAGTPDGGAIVDMGLTPMPDGGVISTLQADVSQDQFGNRIVDLNTTSAVDPNYKYQGASNDPNIIRGQGITDDIQTFTAEIKDFWQYNKKPILVVTGLVLAWKAGVFTQTHTVKRRK